VCTLDTTSAEIVPDPAGFPFSWPFLDLFLGTGNFSISLAPAFSSPWVGEDMWWKDGDKVLVIRPTRLALVSFPLSGLLFVLFWDPLIFLLCRN